jgi:predicted GIY-YIG superfamily endonuclease
MYRIRQKIWKWYVYILETKDGYYYTGMTWDPSIRYEQHLSGFGGKYTSEHGVSRLVYLEEHTEFELARQREIQIKDFSRKKKKVLIDEFLSDK